MLDSFKGSGTYIACLQKARQNNEVGVYKHMRSPQPETSRLGFKGKRPSKKALRELAERKLQEALDTHNPTAIHTAVLLSKYR